MFFSQNPNTNVSDLCLVWNRYWWVFSIFIFGEDCTQTSKVDLKQHLARSGGNHEGVHGKYGRTGFARESMPEHHLIRHSTSIEDPKSRIRWIWGSTFQLHLGMYALYDGFRDDYNKRNNNKSFSSDFGLLLYCVFNYFFCRCSLKAFVSLIII